MTRKDFKNWVQEKIRILDGATGTLLQKSGMPTGINPEIWVLENPQIIKQIQSQYVENGTDIIYAFTFGSNKIKLKEAGAQNRVYDINKDLVKISKEAADNKAFVAGDLAPTGALMAPFGDYTFEDIVNVYKEQVKGL